MDDQKHSPHSHSSSPDDQALHDIQSDSQSEDSDVADTTSPLASFAHKSPLPTDVLPPTPLKMPKKGGLKLTHELKGVSDIQPPQHHSRRIVLSSFACLALLLALSAVWYKFNTNVYTLGLPGTAPAPTQVATNATPTPTDQPQTLGAGSGQMNLRLTLTNLKPLSRGHYQAWIAQDGQTTSIGAFNPSTAGPLVDLKGAPFNPAINYDGNDAEIIITIEPGQVITTKPSASVILSGNLQNKQANLTFSAIDLNQAKGVFTLATPTDPNGSTQTSGLWFAKTDGQTLIGPGLDIPAAPAGWKYEGQVIYKGVVVAMGRFSSKEQADDFNKYSSDGAKSPNLPGEDYLANTPATLGSPFPANLTSGEWSVMVSLEPDQENADPTGDDTFFLQPLKAAIPQGATAYKEYPLTLDISQFPSGKVELTEQ
jgi:hypothetical protein